MKIFRRRRRYGSQQVAEHLRTHLGAPFAVMAEQVARGAEVEIHGFRDAPTPGKVVTATVGLAAYSRHSGCAAGHAGAEELMLVVDQRWFGEQLLDFFVRCVAVHAQAREPLDPDEPIRLSSPVPGTAGLRHLLAIPAAIVTDEFPVVEEPAGTTVLWMLVPVHADEADLVAEHGSDGLYEMFEDQQVDVTDLDRGSCVSAAP